MNTKKRIALVIGSDGIKCAAAAGLRRDLQEEGIVVDNKDNFSDLVMMIACSLHDLLVDHRKRPFRL